MEIRRARAMKLRLRGRSYNEIQRELGIPKSTLSGWFRGMPLSSDAQERLQQRVHQGSVNGLVKRNRMQTHIARQRAKKIRLNAAKSLHYRPQLQLTILGAALYWAEGYKRPKKYNGKVVTYHPISFTNSDPEMVQVFVRFLTEVLNVKPKAISVWMRLYEHINEVEARNYWMSVTGLVEENFRKPMYLVSRASQGKRPFDRLRYGTVCLAVNSTPKFYELMGLLDGVKESFVRQKRSGSSVG